MRNRRNASTNQVLPGHSSHGVCRESIFKAPGHIWRPARNMVFIGTCSVTSEAGCHDRCVCRVFIFKVTVTRPLDFGRSKFKTPFVPIGSCSKNRAGQGWANRAVVAHTSICAARQREGGQGGWQGGAGRAARRGEIGHFGLWRFGGLKFL